METIYVLEAESLSDHRPWILGIYKDVKTAKRRIDPSNWKPIPWGFETTLKNVLYTITEHPLL